MGACVLQVEDLGRSLRITRKVEDLGTSLRIKGNDVNGKEKWGGGHAKEVN